MSSASTTKPHNPSRPFPWRVWVFLLIAAFAGAAAVLPMAFEIFRPLIKSSPGPNIPLPIIVVISVVQNGILLGLATGVGLLLSRKLGLGVPQYCPR